MIFPGIVTNRGPGRATFHAVLAGRERHRLLPGGRGRGQRSRRGRWPGVHRAALLFGLTRCGSSPGVTSDELGGFFAEKTWGCHGPEDDGRATRDGPAGLLRCRRRHPVVRIRHCGAQLCRRGRRHCSRVRPRAARPRLCARAHLRVSRQSGRDHRRAGSPAGSRWRRPSVLDRSVRRRHTRGLAAVGYVQRLTPLQPVKDGPGHEWLGRREPYPHQRGRRLPDRGDHDRPLRLCRPQAPRARPRMPPPRASSSVFPSRWSISSESRSRARR